LEDKEFQAKGNNLKNLGRNEQVGIQKFLHEQHVIFNNNQQQEQKQKQ